MKLVVSKKCVQILQILKTYGETAVHSDPGVTSRALSIARLWILVCAAQSFAGDRVLSGRPHPRQSRRRKWLFDARLPYCSVSADVVLIGEALKGFSVSP